MKDIRFFGFYPRDEDKFAGEYIAVVKGKIVAHGREPERVLMKARKVSREPILVKVPSRGWKEAMILCMRLDLRVKR